MVHVSNSVVGDQARHTGSLTIGIVGDVDGRHVGCVGDGSEILRRCLVVEEMGHRWQTFTTTGTTKVADGTITVTVSLE